MFNRFIVSEGAKLNVPVVVVVTSVVNIVDVTVVVVDGYFIAY